MLTLITDLARMNVRHLNSYLTKLHVNAKEFESCFGDLQPVFKNGIFRITQKVRSSSMTGLNSYYLISYEPYLII